MKVIKTEVSVYFSKIKLKFDENQHGLQVLKSLKYYTDTCSWYADRVRERERTRSLTLLKDKQRKKAKYCWMLKYLLMMTNTRYPLYSNK